jgi:hypothetical protein
MAFAGADRQGDLSRIVERLPDACKTYLSVSRFATNNTGLFGSIIQGQAASEAIRHADQLIADYDRQGPAKPAKPAKQDVPTLLRSIPNATPRLTSDIIKLIKRLQAAIDPNKQTFRIETFRP